MTELTKYIACDSVEFDSKDECEKYERKIKINNLFKIDFFSPLTRLSDGYMYVFHCDNKEQHKEIEDVIISHERCPDNSRLRDGVSFPCDCVAMCPDCYDWIGFVPLNDVKDGLYKAMCAVMKYERENKR